jgi:hypothetical protein
VLVVVEKRDVHALAQFALDDETFRRLDVLEIDGAEGGFQGRDDVHHLDRIGLVDLDVEGVDAGEFLEQDRLALHHRLGGQGADGAEPEDGGAVGDHAHHVAPGRQVSRITRVLDDGKAGRRHPRRIGQRQVKLGGQRLGGHHLEFPRLRLAVVFQGRFVQTIRHRLSP